MNKKWDAITQSDCAQMANCPGMEPSDNYTFEPDQNPCGYRRPKHMDPNWIPPEKLQSFTLQDTDTVHERWCCKQVIMGNIIGMSTSIDYGKWSIVLRTVIKWEERQNLKIANKITVRCIRKKANKKPTDLKEWEQTHENTTRSNTSYRKNVRRRIR